MRKFIILLLICSVFAGSCKKEQSRHADEDASPAVLLEVDGQLVTSTDSDDNQNDCSVFRFGGVAGNYFVLRSAFRINEKTTIEVSLGTALSSNNQLTEDEFLKIIGVGSKDFGSLGAFTSYPQLKPGKVEIAFTDKQGKRWSTTRITEKQTSYGVETSVEIVQKKSEFVVTEVSHLDDHPGGEYLVKGRFDCFVHEVNGHAKKKMKGEFSGLFRRTQE